MYDCWSSPGGQLAARIVPYVAAEARHFSFVKGQIAFFNPDQAISSDMVASIKAELDPPA